MKTVKKKTLKLDKRSYILFALIGVVLIGVLLIVQTRFKKDMRLSDDGFAIISGTITDSLSADPNSVDANISETVTMYEFKALDYFYTQSKFYYLGEEEKTKIDVSYPIYMKHGTALQIVDNSAVLFDEDYEEVVTYRGLILQGGHSFNINGEQADPMKFLFVELNNGNYINLEEIYYEGKNREYDINVNSIIHFDDDYFSYYEYEDGVLLYKYRISVNDDTILNVGGVDRTYDELMKLLKRRTEVPEFDIVIPETETEIPSIELPTGEEADGDYDDEETETETEPVTEPETEPVTEPETEPVTEPETEPVTEPETESVTEEETEKEKETETETEPETESVTEPETEEDEEETESSKEDEGNKVSPGVRPDTMRPDKNPDKNEDSPEKVPDYVKPIVNVLQPFTGNVYRIVSEIEVIDPVKRIDKKRLVQFEVYEVSNGKETLVTRGYCSGSGTVILGGGSVKPETEYRVVGFFTYNDEYNVSQVEQLGEWNVTTKSVDTLGIIELAHQQGATYSDRIEIENICYVEGSDEEAIYGINTAAGITLQIKNENGNKIITQKIISSSDVTNFKRNARLAVSTLAVLDAKTTYKYEFVVKDYFGNELKLENETGYAITCNHTPKASIKLPTNEIANVQFEININDVDAAGIPTESDPSKCDIYIVLTDNSNTISSLEDESVVTYHKLSEGEYSYSEETGIVVNNLVVTFDSLDLDTQMFASVYCDYDLQNRAGAQRFKQIGQLKFTTTGLSSLGKIYVDVLFDDENLTHCSLPISYTLNTLSTNSELSKLIVGFSVDVVGGTGDDAMIYDSMGFTKESITLDGFFAYEKFKEGGTLNYTAKNLESMTAYNLVPTISLEYNGKIYNNVPVVLSKSTFKTLRKPAEVDVKDLLFAAGTLIFDVTVNDPDETIVGASGDKVVVNLYTTSGEFVQATRVIKNLDEPQTVTFNNLDVNKKYEIRFLAVEYNEGYSNATYISNYVIKTIKVSESVRLDGTIKLQEINNIENDDIHYSAIVKATMNDPDHYLSRINAIPYFITVKKNGIELEKNEYWKNDEPVATEYVTNYEYIVDKGDNTYTLELFVIISGRPIVLDTLKFTSEATVEGFSNAYEMITKISANPDAKFVATNSFVLNGNTWNFPGIIDPGDVGNMSDDDLAAAGIVLEQGLSGTNIASIFDGKIDFQGFTLTHNYRADGQNIFTNIGAAGEITNMVYKVYLMNEAYINDDSCICYRNYGKISNIYVDFSGSINIMDNRKFSLICRTNCSTGIVENFVIHNNPGEIVIAGEKAKLNGFSAYQNAGFITPDNYGVIRYGYVYGENIIATNASGNLDRRVGGLVGTNQAIGKVYSVYSLLNVDQVLRNNSQGLTYGYRYGAVCGYSTGLLQNLYSTAESMYKENKNDSVNFYQKTPVVGDTANRNSSVYFYSPSDFEYIYAIPSAIKGVSEMSLNNLYDPGWQNVILTEKFDISNVEVGYYPHVILDEDLPVQEYISLPVRTMSSEVDLSRAKIIEYYLLNQGTESETSAALVEFVFSNRDGLDIAALDIEGLTVKLDLATANTEDGYTTILGLVTNPETFNSEYLIRKVCYYRNNVLKENTIDYTLLADFYRSIYTVDDWYNYVVLKAGNNECENVRIMADIDFDGVVADKIIVTGTFTAKIDGNNHTLKNIDLQAGLKTTSTYAVRNLFSASPSIDYSGVVSDLYIENYKAGGTYTTKNKTYVARYGSVFRTVKGTINGVHLKDAQITSFDYEGGIVAYVDVGAEIINCTVKNIDIVYQEPDNQNIDASIGGVAGYVTNARITHCLATGVTITAEEMKSSNGIGGVVGYSTNTAIDTIYAEGDIDTRGTKAGGVIGEYYSTSASVACVKNVFAKVDIISYTDSVGGLVGQLNLTQDRINERNNFSGIAFGNVYVANPDSENITHTIGSNIGKNVKFHGTDRQLVNGLAGIGVNEYAQTVVVDLLGYDDLMSDKAINTYIGELGFEDVYDFTYAENGYLPKMYYANSNTLLPNQPDILLDDTAGYDIEVTNVFTNTDTRIITVELRNPNNYIITDINIQKIKYHYADLTANPGIPVTIDKASDYSEGYTRIYLQYEDEQSQEYFLDSYVLDNIKFDAGDGKIVDLPTFSRIGVTLYMDIPTEEVWNSIAVRETQGHLYENYRVTADLDFATKQISHNLRIGRLSATSGAGITIRNVNLSGAGKNLISRLNSGISNLTFENCSISSSGANCTGIIGVNNGSISNCNFKNITITPLTANKDEAGIIAHQNGGKITNIYMDNVKVFAYASNKTGIDYVGALCGKVADGSVIADVNASNLEVYGATTVGGIAGQVYISNIDNITLNNVVVDSYGNYVGGFTGRLGTDSNGRSGAFDNVVITGVPTYDAQGVINGSTTTISTSTGSYTGGIAGQCYHMTGENVAVSDNEVLVDGVVVKGYADNIGGIFGYNYQSIYHITIKNSLISTADATDTTHKRVGGVIGYEEYGTGKYFTADNIYINSKNHSQVGGLIGYCNSASMQYSYIIDSVINATSKTVGTWTQAGGAIGYHNAGTSTYVGVFNTVINAESMNCVGGIVGQLGTSVTSSTSIQRCFNISGYDEQAYSLYGISTTRYTAASKPEDYIKGYNYVGGIAGSLTGGNIQYSYSNGNVIAGKNQCAGGLVGYYGNEYIPVSSNGKSYSNAYMYRNYFAGNVTAINGYAGGIIGRTGLIAKGYGTDSTGKVTGSGENGSRIKGVNGNYNESDKTYGNIVFADSITGAPDKTRNFAADDKSYLFTGKNNTLWDGTIVNGEYTANIIYNNDYAYSYWNTSNAVTTAYPLTGTDAMKLLLFKHSDLDDSRVASSGSNASRHKRAAMYYRNIGWTLSYTTSTTNNYMNRNTVWAASVKGFKDTYEATGYNLDNYLPQIRSGTGTKYASDLSITLQNKVARLPLPNDDACQRIALNNLTTVSMPEIDTYGMIYSSDVDKINVEFSKDLLKDGYFILTVGGVEVANMKITERVYTFSYGFNETVVLEYGNSTAKIATTSFDAKDIANRIMVYDDDYYYISESGIVSSSGTQSGEFVHLMNGKALNKEGNIIDVYNQTVIGTVNKTDLLENTSALWSFEYMGYVIETYAKHSHIISDVSDVIRDDQLLVKNNSLYTVDGAINTNKTTMLLYNLNGTDYLTVLGMDGFMVDLFNSDCNIPETVDNKAIVAMTNTINANVPYVIVEYSNGGMIGYNYATGNILFDNSIASNVTIFDYAVEFFTTDDESMYADISNSYKTNASIAASVHSTVDLEKIVGNSTDASMNANQGENTGIAGENQSIADAENSKPVDNDNISLEEESNFGETVVDGDVSGEDNVENTTENEISGVINESEENNNEGKDDKEESVTGSADSTDPTEPVGSTGSIGTTDPTEPVGSTGSTGTTDPTEPVGSTGSAGSTESEKPTGSADSTDGSSSSESSKPTESIDSIGDKTMYMTLYNSNTGVYEIVNVVEYLSQENFVTENEKLGVKDFSDYSNGYASATIDVKQERGLIFYIIPVALIFAIAAGVEVYISYKKRRNSEVN